MTRYDHLIALAETNGESGALDDSWSSVDLAAVIDGNASQPEPTILRRDDGRALFYPGVINGVHGDSGIGKGWLICHAAHQVIRQGGTALLIDLEDTAASIVGRLLAMGVTESQIIGHLKYVRPQTPFDPRAVMEVIALCQRESIGLVAIDSLGEAFGLEGIDENKDAEVGPWYRGVARPIAEAGPALVVVDHSTKASDNPLHPSGSKRKRAAVGGASYLVEAARPFVKGDGGRLRITCAKDRHGHYRRGEVVADLVMDSNGVDVRLALYAPSTATTGTELPTLLVAREVVAIVKASASPLSKSALRGLIKTKCATDTKKSGIDFAIDSGALDVEAGPRGARHLRYAHELAEDVS